MWFCGNTLVWIFLWVYRLLSSNILGHGNGFSGSALSPSACCLQLLLKADTWGGIRTKWSYSGISCANSPYQEASEPGAVFLHFIDLMSSTVMYLSIYPSTSIDIQPNHTVFRQGHGIPDSAQAAYTPHPPLQKKVSGPFQEGYPLACLPLPRAPQNCTPHLRCVHVGVCSEVQEEHKIFLWVYQLPKPAPEHSPECKQYE